MSSQSVTSNTGQQLFINTDTSKVFLGGNYTRTDGLLNNTTYNPLVLPAGTVIGRVSATGGLAPFNASASDGTQFVVGVLTADVSIDPGATTNVSVTVAGRVAQDKISLFYGGQTLSTVVSGRMVKDKICGESVGLLIVPTTELTDYDNS